MRFDSKKAMAAYFRENPGLTTLRVEDCPGITSLPPLPITSKSLPADICPGLISLAALPSTLTFLPVNKCSGLTSRRLRVGKLTIEIR